MSASRHAAGLAFAAALAAFAALPAGAEIPSRSEDSLRESVLRLASGDVAGAESEAKAAVSADPTSVRALQQLARAANAALDFAAAEDAATRALLVAGQNPALLCLRSEARSGRGDYDGALADAQTAARINPGSGAAVLRAAVAKEGLRRPSEESLSDYRRAAELDPALTSMRDAAIARLAPPTIGSRPGLGLLIALLAAAGAVAWGWSKARRSSAPAPRFSSGRQTLAGSGRMAPREAARALAVVCETARDPQAVFELACVLYARLTGSPPIIAEGPGQSVPPASTIARDLPVGIDAFFERALNPDPARRFRTGAELLGAFRSLVDPSVD